MSRLINRKKHNRHSIDITDPSSIAIMASIRPATPLFHRTLRRSVQDSKTYQAIIPLSMGRIHFIQNHMNELQGMINPLPTALRLRRNSQNSQFDSSYRPPSTLKRRLIAKSPFPGRTEFKNSSPPDTPTRRTPTPAMRNFKLPKGIIEEYEGDYVNGTSHGEGKALHSNGDTYQGQWFEGKKQGIGTYFYNYFGASYHGDWHNDEKNGFGVLKFSNGDELEGLWENGFLNGENTIMRFANGCYYQGSSIKGLRTGRGRMKYLEGPEYLGGWKDDCRDGLGSLSFNDAWFFEGYFKNDLTEGPGILVYRTSEATEKNILWLSSTKAFHPLLPFLQDLQEFQDFLTQTHYIHDTFIFTLPSGPSGMFKGGKLNGSGVAIYSKYAVYSGNFLEGKRYGIGKMVYSDPEHALEFLGETEGEYIGQWKDDQRHGQGVMMWPNGLRYEGRFNNDKRNHVTGKLFFQNGNIYEGGFVDDKMQGVGTLLMPNGMRFTGRFISGNSEDFGVLEYNNLIYEGECENYQPNGKGKLRYPNGDTYEGEMHYSVVSGEGKLLYANGGFYIGEFNMGKRSGKGKMVYQNGNCYEGAWARDKREGYGVYKDRNGVVVYSGDWKDDRQEGRGVIRRIKIKNNVK